MDKGKPQMSPEDAEASEKLVDGGDKIEIRPPSATPQNGDTRIDMVDVKQAFVGMGKEELMKFANDPFWVKLRWFLFGLFWFLWFGMLFGAVAIIAYAPKCSAPSARDWFEKSPLYYINADQITHDADGNDLPLSQGLLLMKDHLISLGIRSILLDVNSENSQDFKALPAKYGKEEALKKTLSTLREADIHTFLKIVPNHASVNHPWFTKSALKENPYSSYFVWAKGKDGGLPSNWNTFNGAPAWTMNNDRGEFYLHQANSSYADFNFRNPEVVDYFSDVFKHWLEFGFCGIHLEKVMFLVENENLDDELPSSVNAGNLGDYNFYTHAKTANLDESYAIIRQWAAVISNSSGVLSIDQVSDPAEVPAKLIHRPFILRPGSNTLQDQLESYIQNVNKKPHQTWLLDPDTTEKLSEANTVGINLLFMLLPDTSLFASGLEMGQISSMSIKLSDLSRSSQNSSKENLLTTFKKVVELRESPSITYGATNIITNTSVLLVSRLKTGNPGYLISLNLDNEVQDVDLNVVQSQGVGDNFKLIASSDSFEISNHGRLKEGAIESSVITMPPTSFAVIEYIITTS